MTSVLETPSVYTHSSVMRFRTRYDSQSAVLYQVGLSHNLIFETGPRP